MTEAQTHDSSLGLFADQLSDQLCDFAVTVGETLDHPGLHPFDDEAFELSDLQLAAQALGDCFADGAPLTNVTVWLQNARARLTDIENLLKEASGGSAEPQPPTLDRFCP